MAKVKSSKGKGAEKVTRAAVRHHEKAPCSQGFSVAAKPGQKRKSWWNGFKPSVARPDAD